MTLLVDIGNTRIKWLFDSMGEFEKSQALDYKTADFKSKLIKSWKQSSLSPTQLWISCVANKLVFEQVRLIALALWPEINIHRVETTIEAFNVRNAYNQPEKLGVDRWLALIAAHHNYKFFACIVDCGSAITLDLIDTNGIHQGGLIIPGINMMKQSLVNNTAALPRVEKKFTLALSDNTEAAIYCGIMYSIIGMINSIVKQQDAPVKLILTGGDAELVAQYLEQDLIIDADLVLKGLKVFAQHLL